MAANPKRLLIVDDEEDLLFMLALSAESTGEFVVEKARDGKEGLAKALRFHPDAAVLDGIMPVMDGFELCRRLRANPRTKRLPIVILSAGEPARCEALAKTAGADRFVRKPYDQGELMRLLLSLSRKKTGGSPTGEKEKGRSAAGRIVT